jgi:hypothetical protein
MMPKVTPVSDLTRRMPEQGRIRLGEQVPNKGGKGTHPAKLAHFRFTSADKEALDALAALYGGSPRVWTDAPVVGQWELYSEADEIPVVLPPNPLGDGIIYEQWNRGGLLRRCDGEWCDQPVEGPDGPEMAKVPCLCNAERGAPVCKPKLRLNVVLKDIKFGGSWRLETSSENAVHEMPGMIDMIQALQAKGMVLALLRLEQRVKYERGKKKEFAVPALGVAETLDGIVAGNAAIGAYTTAPTRALASPPTPETIDVTDSEPTEAEILVNDEVRAELDAAAELVVEGWNDRHPEGPISGRQLLQLLAAQLTGHPNQQVAALTEEQGDRVRILLADIIGGRVEFSGIRDGRAKVRRNPEA